MIHDVNGLTREVIKVLWFLEDVQRLLKERDQCVVNRSELLVTVIERIED